MIDLHTHTTASDGRSAPASLVREAAEAGIRTLAVTDHDTVAGHEDAIVAGRRLGVTLIRGIEITAVHEGRDVHVLGYFVDHADEAFRAFLVRQREDRQRRVAAIVDRLATLGYPLDRERLLDVDRQPRGRAIGRPAVARALVAAGHVASVEEAFQRFLGRGCPAFVSRAGAPPVDVIGHLVRIGAVAAMAHPGKSDRDDLIDGMVDAGMAAIEVFHPDHADEDTRRYTELARARGLLRTGGSDYHGPGSGRADALGRVGLPLADFEALLDLAGRVRTR